MQETTFENEKPLEKPLENNNRLATFYEIVGSAAGIIGSLLMSITTDYILYCWYIWLLTSIAFILFSIEKKLKYMFFLQLTFLIIDIFGIINCLKQTT